MVKSVRFLLLLIAFVSMQIVAWGQPQERLVQVQVTPDHTNWLYKPGEKVKFKVAVLKCNIPQDNLEVRIIRKTKCSPLFKRSDISYKTKRPPKNNFPKYSRGSKKSTGKFCFSQCFFFKFRWLCQLKFVSLCSVRVVFVHHSNTI